MASTISSYNNDKVVTGEVEYPANDPASGAFFQPDFKRNEDLKMMLDGSKDSLKLEAMKRIIGMIAKGRDASDLFPAVVKNVVSKNIEVKKLVYVYLVRYAEQQQDLALLSISTFQRALKDPNQLIRASALRVLSSIRVSMIVPIVMLAIRDSAADMSPYVRKTAAHAIPKLYSLDPEQKEELIGIIEKLLSDKTPLVVGSAAMAFSEVCATRLSLLHNSYRKLCLLLADVDEWGQVALLNALTEYARTHFPDPNADSNQSTDSDSDKPFYDSDSDSTRGDSKRGDSKRGDSKRKKSRGRRSPAVEPDLRLLLRAARPLLQSRSSGVVLAVARLFHHVAPVQEMAPVAKAMIRLLRSPIEVQSVVLNTIASLTVTKRSLFEPYLKSFFVRMSDPTHIKLLKLEILTNLCSESTAPAVLRELQTYVACSDRALAAAAIQAIGRAAIAVETETQSCLNAALHLLSSKHEWVVCEAVLVVKRALGAAAPSAARAVARAARLLRSDRLAGTARAAGVWLVAEHGASQPRAAAVLAHLAASFADQEELVKLQLLSLAAKLSVSQPDTRPLVDYVMTMAKYDASYDVRDRARLLSKLILRPNAGKALLAPKPAPAASTAFTDRQNLTLGTLSQYIGRPAAGYRPLPPPPAAPLAPGLRDPPAPPAHSHKEHHKDKSFYSDPGSSSGSSSSSSGSSSEESSDEEPSDNEDNKQEKPKETTTSNRSSKSSSSDSESDSSSSDESDDQSDDGSGSSDDHPPTADNDDKKPSKQPQNDANKSNLELLLELDAVASNLPTMTPTLGGFLTPMAGKEKAGDDDAITPVGPPLVPTSRSALLARVSCNGLSATRRWPRAPHLYHENMITVEICFTNHAQEAVTNIRVNKKTLTGSRALHEFPPLGSLPPGGSAVATLGVHFADSIQPIEFTIACSIGEFPASITPPVGELVRAVSMPPPRWRRERDSLRGLHECEKKASITSDASAVKQRVFETANVGAVPSDDGNCWFAGQLKSSRSLVLVSVETGDVGVVRAHCYNVAVASMLASELANALAMTG